MEILLRLDGEAERGKRRRVLIPATAKQVATYEHCPIYHDNDVVSGEAVIKLCHGQQFGHKGVYVELLGLIEKRNNGGGEDEVFEFLRVKLPLLGAEESPLRDPISRLPFSFGPVKMPYESFDGLRVCLHYSVRLVILQRAQDLIKERTLWLSSTNTLRTPTAEIIEQDVRVEVGLDEFLQMEMDFTQTRFPLDAIQVRGQLRFILVRLRIAFIELNFMRREIIDGSTAKSQAPFQDALTIARHQIMEGPAYRGDCIPFELNLLNSDDEESLTITYEQVARQFSVRYYIVMVIHDEEGRRYFRQQEITLVK